jgi:molecular chaperone HtpG
LTEKPEFDAHVPLEIRIDCKDKTKKMLTVTDTGIGMTAEELEANLGTIAHSGSGKFLAELAEAAKKDVKLIGKFGVGFYSAFMAAKTVKVQSRSWDGSQGHEWFSDGNGTYTITPCDGLHRGTKIIMELKEGAEEYAQDINIERIVKQYSSFAPFPVKVDGKKINTVEAIWLRSKSEIKDKEYNDFYKFIGNGYDEPLQRFHFSVDTPLAINALLFIPKDNMETVGLGRIDPGVNLHCRRVLIDQHSKSILPEWLRFLQGVVDSEDLPLNISRQSLQDNALVAKIRRVITKRFLKFLDEEAKSNKEQYAIFWKTFGHFMKEGIANDFEYHEEIAKLLRFESSANKAGEMISLEEYVSRMPEKQQEIYYINGPNRAAIEGGPYIEMFKQRGIEILYTLEPIDDFVLSHLGAFEEKKLVSADQADLRLPEAPEQEEVKAQDQLAEAVQTSLCKWIKELLGDKVKEVKPSTRLVNSPAMIVNESGYMTSTMERMLAAQGHCNKDNPMLIGNKKDMEINPASPLIKKVADLRATDQDFAKDLAEQIFDNAMIQAGLMIDPQQMVSRSYRIMERMAG